MQDLQNKLKAAKAAENKIAGELFETRSQKSVLQDQLASLNAEHQRSKRKLATATDNLETQSEQLQSVRATLAGHETLLSDAQKRLSISEAALLAAQLQHDRLKQGQLSERLAAQN